jgi:hypothetical protein
LKGAGHAAAFLLQAESDSRIARESLQVHHLTEHDRGTPIVGVELMRLLGTGSKRVLERVCTGRGNVGGKDRAAGKGNLDADGIR